MALQALVQNVVVNWGVKSYRFLPYFSKYKKMIFGKNDTGWSPWSQSRSERKRDPLYHSFSFSFSPTRSPNFSLSSEREKEIWRPSFQFWGDNEISQKLIMKIERNRNFVYQDQQRKRLNIIQIQKFTFQNLSRPLSGYMSTQKLTWAGFCHVQNQTWKKPVCPRRGISHILSLVLLKSCWNAIKIIWEKSMSAKMWSILERSLV